MTQPTYKIRVRNTKLHSDTEHTVTTGDLEGTMRAYENRGLAVIHTRKVYVTYRVIVRFVTPELETVMDEIVTDENLAWGKAWLKVMDYNEAFTASDHSASYWDLPNTLFYVVTLADSRHELWVGVERKFS